MLLLAPVTHGREASQQEEKTTPSYEELLARVKSGDETVDFRALRFSYEGEGDVTESLKGLFKAIGKENYEKALKRCNAMLEELYISIDAHIGCIIANRGLGNAEKSAYHKLIVNGLMESIMGSSDGHSPETAWEVISIEEEYAVMRALAYRWQDQSLEGENGRMYDVFTVKTQEGESFELYFNIDKFFGAAFGLPGKLKGSKDEDEE